MFGWYVDFYYNPTTGSVGNMSQLKLADENRPFLIPELLSSPGTDEETSVSFSAWGLAYETLKTYVGDYVNVIYTPPERQYYKNYLGLLTDQFPSITKSAVNTWAALGVPVPDSLYDRGVYIYFRNTKKLIKCDMDGSYVILQDNNGPLTQVWSTGAYFQFPFAAMCEGYNSAYVYDVGFRFPALLGTYTGIDSLLNQKWRWIRVGRNAHTGSGQNGWITFSSVRDPATDTNLNSFLKILLTNNEPDFEYNPGIPPENPYGPGGDSEPGTEPPGTFDDSSDAIPDSSLPTISAANTGFTRIYNPTLAQVQDLARYLWTDDTILETIWNKIRQYFENPMDAIIGFNLVPVAVPNGGTKNFALMYIDTGVQMTAAASQFVDQDCGTVKLERFYGSALDQSPYTKVSCFLPYIGTVQLNTDEVMGATLQVKYRVDIVSGSCVAKILVDGNVLYQYSGHCAITIPISATDFSSYVQAAINVAKIIGGVVSGGAAGGAMAAMGSVASTPLDQETSQIVTRSTNKEDGSNAPQHRGSSGTGPSDSNSKISTTKASFSGLSPANIANTVGEIMGSKPIIEHSGSFSGNSGYLGVRRPFLIIERPNMCMPKSYQTMNGFPAMITMKLGDCQGYTRVQQVQLTGMSATNPEQAEILNLLKGGVLL